MALLKELGNPKSSWQFEILFMNKLTGDDKYIYAHLLFPTDGY